MRNRITLTVEISLDPVPGAMHTPEDVHMRVANILSNHFVCYNPVVTINPPTRPNPLIPTEDLRGL